MFNSWLKVCEDYELWIRLTSKIPIYLVKEACTIKYGGHEGQLSKQYWAMDRFRIRALEKLMLSFKLSKIQKMEM